MPISTTNQLHIEKLHKQMKERRQQGETIFLRQLLDSEYPEYYSENPDYRLEKYYHDMGFDFNRMTVQQSIDAATGDTSNRILWGETIAPILYEALYVDNLHLNLISGSQPMTEATHTQPYYDFSGKRRHLVKGREIPVGGDFPQSKLDVFAKTLKPKKYGDSIPLPYETIADVRLPVLAEFLKVAALLESLDKIAYINDILINGDGAIDSEKETEVDSSACVIGVVDPAKGIQFYDIKRACFYMNQLRMTATIGVGPSEECLRISELDEFKIPRQGTPIAGEVKINGKFVVPTDFITDDTMADNTFELLCPLAGCTEHIRQGFMVEEDKIVSRQVIRLVYSERIAYCNLWRTAKVVIDGTKEYASNPLPTWFTVQKGK